jgi:hypothetical protein
VQDENPKYPEKFSARCPGLAISSHPLGFFSADPTCDQAFTRRGYADLASNCDRL